MKHPLAILSLLLGILVICLIILRLRSSDSAAPSLTLYCAAGLQAPIEEIVNDYKRETGTSIHVIYNGSGALLSQLQLGQGDLYLPANQTYIEMANDYLDAPTTPVVEQQAVIVVHQSNQSIHSIADLANADVRISFAEDSAAIGKHAKTLLQQHQLWDTISPQIVVYKPTVNGVIEDVALQSVDATIAWKNTALNLSKVKTIDSPELLSTPQHATISVLKSSQSKAEAQKFINFLTSAPSSQNTFKNHHFNPAKP
ncbi:molybdate ABC transporter substrate-binding protein [Rubritalea sp.]|uniref:molybdate ABC transporter substrate-binding protein n=1 Tax=Rubritalea sp. TaxID=2109375 RepID=UPI003EF40E53